jgi:hypothetical protein
LKKHASTTYLVSVGSKGDSESASETKVGEFEITISVDEQVLRLEITVKDSMGVEVMYAFDELECLVGWSKEVSVETRFSCER